MENRIYKTKTASQTRSQSQTRLKFKEINPNSFNELNSKYELYKQGTPNTYEHDLMTLKANNIKNSVATLELPAVDYVIQQMAQTQQNKQINQRNFDLYPSLLKSGNGRYKEMLSEKQEVKDFILWFQGQFQQIEGSHDSANKKFQDKQTLIAAGFTEMIAQIAKITKNRAEILKMLWNREHTEIKMVVESLNGQVIKKQKTLLEQISSLHKEYQDQMDQLVKANRQLEEKYNQEKVFSRACVGDLRILRKRVKKLQYVGRKLGQTNGNAKKQNFHLLEENIKLMASIKEITPQESAVLNFRKLQLSQQRKNNKVANCKQLLALTDPTKEESFTPLLDLEEKKNSLQSYFLQRIKQNPDEQAFIKDEDFPDEEVNRISIDQYFTTVINKPSIQIELLNEAPFVQTHKDKATSTDPIEEEEANAPICLDKGIQVEPRDNFLQNTMRGSGSLTIQGDMEKERKVYHVIDKKEEEHKQKQSKMRIIQHRLSRRNSLTLLQLQKLGDLNNKKNDKKSTNPTNFAKKGTKSGSNFKKGCLDTSNQNIKQTIINEDSFSDGSSVKSSNESAVLLDNIDENSELMTINVRTTQQQPVRKSHRFHTMLKTMNQSSVSPEKKQSVDKQVIHLDGEQQELIKISQLDDLIEKHLEKGQQKTSHHGVEKNLKKVFNNLYKNVWHKQNINLKMQILEVIKQSYGNVKSVLWKFLNIVGIVKENQSSNPLLKIMSLLLKLNTKYTSYNEVNTPEVADLFFRLFQQLTIKTIHDVGFNIWKSCTTIDKIRTIDFMSVIEGFFSEKKRRYIQTKITQLMATSKQELKSKKGVVNNSSNKRIQIVSQQASIIKLNPLLLYILQVYLIEKQLYFSSYSCLTSFISEDGIVQGQVFVWLLDLLGFSQQKQKNMIDFALPVLNRKSFKQTDENKEKKMKIDMFYRCCVKFDFPIMQQLSVSTYSQLKQLPQQIKQNYYRMIGLQEWTQIRKALTNRYTSLCEQPLYLKAFQFIAGKLQNEILKGGSIYGDPSYQDKAKRKQEVFSLFFRILIIESHRDMMGSSKTNELQPPKSRFG